MKKEQVKIDELKNALALSMEDSRWLRKMHPILLKVVFCSLAVTLVSIGTAGVFFAKYKNRPVENHFFTIDSDGKIEREVFPLSNPIASRTAIKDFADGCIRKVFDIDFKHWKKDILAAESCFTTSGFENLISEMKDSETLKSIVANKLVGDIIIQKPNNIFAEGSQRGIYKWKVRGAYVWGHYGGESTKTYNLIIDVTIRRVPRHINSKGIAIEQIIAKQGTIN